MDARLPEGPEAVTERQREVARLVAEGRTNREIADALGITLDGAKYHVSELLGRLGLERREEIAVWYREQHSPRRRLRAAFGLPAVAFAGRGAAVAVGVAVVLVTFFMLNSAAEPESIEAATLDVIDAPHGRWEVLPPPPAPLQFHFAAALDDGRLLIGGGWGADSGEPAGSVWLFDLRNGRYEPIEGARAAAWTNAGAVRTSDGSIVVGAGREIASLQAAPGVSTIYRFEPGSDPLELRELIETGDQLTEIARDGSGRVVASHVEERGGELTVVFSRLDLDGPAMTELHARPAPRARPLFGTLVTVDERTVAFQGQHAIVFIDTITGDVAEVDLPQDLPHEPFAVAAVALDDGRLFVAGGIDADDAGRLARGMVDVQPANGGPYEEPVLGLRQAFISDPATGAIERRADPPSARVGAHAVPLDADRVLIHGGVPFGGFLSLPEIAVPPPLIYDASLDEYVELDGAPPLPDQPTVTPLPDGSVLFIGVRHVDGQDGGEPVAIRFVPDPR